MSERNYGLDIARFVAIIGIIVLHINGRGGVIDASLIGTGTYWMAQWIEILAYCSVDLFALLSGYLGITSPKRSSNRALELLSISVIYCILITFVFMLLFQEQMNVKNVIVGLFPFVKRRYWYLYCYVPVAIFQPFINSFINGLSLKQHRRISLVILLLFSVIPSVIKKDTMGLTDGYSFMWLLICYFIGAYIRKQENEKKKKHHSLRWGILYLFLSTVLLYGNYLAYRKLGTYIDYLVSYISPFVLLMAICLLLCFKNLRFKKERHRIIETLSILSFDVYLLHCHVLIYDIPWSNAFAWISSLNVIIIPFVIIGVALIVAFVCLIPAYIRYKLFKRIPFSRIAKPLDNYLYS